MGFLAVVGSINMDIVNRVERHPLPGETIKGESTAYLPGGKGANQAVAAARAGARVAMFGAVGDDAFGPQLLESLGSAGVDTAGVARKKSHSGLAFITVNRAGENHIVLSEGANGLVTPEDLQQAWTLDGVRAVLLQNEIPWQTNRAAMERARAQGIRIVFNPAPAFPIPEETLPLIDTLVLNESEAELVTGLTVSRIDEAERAAKRLTASGVGEVIVTLGAAGSLYLARDGAPIVTPAFPVTPVDTTAAGDTFIGYYAAALAAGEPAEKALRRASAAAALTVTRRGAQSSIPDDREVERFLSRPAE